MQQNMSVKILKNLIEEASAITTESGHRAHLGGSLIGRPCERELFYHFRWAKKSQFGGRMLRLFSRGHREEVQLVKLLRNIGCNVSEVDKDGRQYQISDIEGHFGGSLDGMANNVPTLNPSEVVLLEFKTHNTKSFSFLANTAAGLKPGDEPALKQCKPEHWSQMQIYMHKRGLKMGLYMAVNKNDDDIYFEFVLYDPEAGPLLIEKARRVILARKPPARVGNHPSWHQCRWCDFSKICHYGEPMEKSCRSCAHSSAADDAKWYCDKWAALIPVEWIAKGCDGYEKITD